MYSTTFEGWMMLCLSGKKVPDMAHNSRENWLLEAVEIMRPWFEEHGATVPEQVRVSVGFAKGQRNATIGVCYNSKAAEDGVHQLFMSPVMDEPVKVLATLMHELIHAWDDCKSGHKGEFRRVAKALGLTGKMTATVPGDELVQRLQDLSGKLGPYPHAKLNTAKMGRTQTTRMIKVHSPSCCGYVVRTTRKWIEQVGMPFCPCGTEMEIG